MNTSVGPSEKVLRALAVFGLPLRTAVAREAGAGAEDAQRAADALARKRCVLLTGASGAGKTTALRALVQRMRGEGVGVVRVNVQRVEREQRAGVDLVRLRLRPALERLARCGLSDATLLARPARELSDGQRWRLALAVALSRRRSTRETVVIADELCAGLDALTSAGVLAGIAAECARTAGLRLVGATSREDIAAMAREEEAWEVVEIGR